MSPTTAAIPLFGLAPAVFRWNAEGEFYEVFNGGEPAFLNTLAQVESLDGLWVFLATEGPVSWPQPGLGPAGLGRGREQDFDAGQGGVRAEEEEEGR